MSIKKTQCPKCGRFIQDEFCEKCDLIYWNPLKKWVNEDEYMDLIDKRNQAHIDFEKKKKERHEKKIRENKLCKHRRSLINALDDSCAAGNAQPSNLDYCKGAKCDCLLWEPSQEG